MRKIRATPEGGGTIAGDYRREQKPSIQTMLRAYFISFQFRLTIRAFGKTVFNNSQNDLPLV